MKLTANNARGVAKRHNRAKYRKDVIYQYKGILKGIKFRAKRGEHSVSLKCRVWDFEEHHAVRLFCYKHRDFKVSWTYDGKQSDGRVDLDRHDKYHITISW